MKKKTKFMVSFSRLIFPSPDCFTYVIESFSKKNNRCNFTIKNKYLNKMFYILGMKYFYNLSKTLRIPPKLKKNTNYPTYCLALPKSIAQNKN